MTDEPTSRTLDDGSTVTPGSAVPPRALDADGDGSPDYSTPAPALLGPLAPYAKALVALLAPGLLIIAAVLSAGRTPTAAEWLTAIGTSLATALAVYATPNRSTEVPRG